MVETFFLICAAIVAGSIATVVVVVAIYTVKALWEDLH